MTQPKPPWITVKDGLLCIDAGLFFEAEGIPNIPENQRYLVERVKKWVRESGQDVPVIEEHQI